MTKLNKKQIKEQAEIVAEIRKSGEALQTAVRAYDVDKTSSWEAIRAAQKAYNETADKACEFCSNIAEQIGAYMDERSEKWQDSDKGQAFSDWKDAWESFECDPVECDNIEDFEEWAQEWDAQAAEYLEELMDVPE
jgi:tRNA U54 and U55 pseudouridine synthase Pus10